MKNVHILARTWRYLLIASSVGLFALFLLPIFFGNYSGKASEFVWSAIIIGGISGTLSCWIITSKLITSPEGIESVSWGMKVKATWDNVERVEINTYGFVNLFFKESLFKNELVNALLRPLAYDKTIQLSPFIDDLATSNLIRDIAKYVPHSNIPEFVGKNKSSTRSFQKVGTIGLYYLGWLFLTVLLAFAFKKGAEYLEASGFQNAILVEYVMSTSLFIGIFVNGMSLLGYNADIAELKDSEISHKARAHYFSPFIALLIGLIGGIIIWAIMQYQSVVVEREESFAIVAMFLGAMSLRASTVIERLIFKDDIS